MLLECKKIFDKNSIQSQIKNLYNARKKFNNFQYKNMNIYLFKYSIPVTKDKNIKYVHIYYLHKTTYLG